VNRQRFINLASAGALALAVVALCFATSAHAQAPATPSPAAKVFAAFDTNHDGSLSSQEFVAGYTGLQRAPALARRLRGQFDAMDTDKSGALDEREYAGLVLVKQAGRAAPPLSAFDADGNRTLGFAEYVALVQKLAPAATAAGGH
jgi:hypothetical protein